ncbi:MAG: ABC transporter substrate-binding protein [Chloroflexi bacterium]|nr:ABC transporter substrate-binding protein [Chloroflexota bacterium]
MPVSRLRVSLACGLYDRTWDLASGSIQPEGIDLTYIALPPHEIFWRMLRYAEWDASELSLSAYTVQRSRGDRRFMAIPVFVSRVFRHGAVFIRTAAGIQTPLDLRGRRIGVPEYHMTAAVWARGLLEHEYGVKASDVHWFTGGQEEPGREERVALHLPPEIRVEPIPPGRWLNEMLLAGELDALISPRPPEPFPDPQDRVVRLFPDFRAVEQDYFRRTGLFPIMHTVVVRHDVYQRDPWVAEALYKAFVAAKAAALARLSYPGTLVTTLPWQAAELEATRAVMGQDPWPYGVEDNRVALEACRLYLQEQGLVEQAPPLEELFAPSTLREFRT